MPSTLMVTGVSSAVVELSLPAVGRWLLAATLTQTVALVTPAGLKSDRWWSATVMVNMSVPPLWINAGSRDR